MFNTECPTCAKEDRCSDELAFWELVLRTIPTGKDMPDCPGHRPRTEKGGEVMSARSSRSPHPSRRGSQNRFHHGRWGV